MDYYSRPEVSNSDLTELKKQLMPIQYNIDVEQAYKFGRLIDAIITEPHLVNYYSLSIGDDKYTQEDFDIAREMYKAFMKDEQCAQLLKLANTQKVMVIQDKDFNHEGSGFRLSVRCKWDMWMQALMWGADIKSTTATSQKQFIDAARHFDYDRQRAWYMDIAGSSRDMLIGISKKNFQIFKIPVQRGDSFYTSGKEKYNELSHLYYQLKIAS